jgi:hypothetical protein
MALPTHLAASVQEDNPLSMSPDELISEFRKHHVQFQKAIDHAMTHEGTSTFHLQKLLEDLDDFSNIADEVGQIMALNASFLIMLTAWSCSATRRASDLEDESDANETRPTDQT